MEKKITLEEARKIIDSQDEIILNGFIKRMEAVKAVAESKTEQGLNTYVPTREKAILDKVWAASPEEIKKYSQELFKKLMELSREYQNNLRVYGLLGRKLGHSFSPEIHKILGEYGQPYSYNTFEVEPEGLEAFILNEKWTGLNVTIPYKTQVMKYCDEISEEARRIGAVNTLIKRRGKILGYNTDYIGFKETLETNQVPVSGAKCIVLGSGGGSKTVVTVLEDMGALEVAIVSRDGKTGCGYEDLYLHYDAKILVNTTPVGMYPNTGVSAAYPGNFPKLEWAIDLIYNPLRTNLLCQAKKSDIETVNGLKMLVSQAKASAEIFTGNQISDKAVLNIEKMINDEKINYVLIGMPGCGKSTVGRAMAEKTGRPFIDTDTLVTEKAGKAIPEIFKEYGEEAFRQLEIQVAESLKNTTGAVIACGGGIVMREENYYSLAENGRLIFLNRKPEGLPTEGRPVSQSIPLERLYAHRLPLYRSWCDMEIDADGYSLQELVQIILE